MDSESLSYKTLKNSSYLFIGFVVPMLFTVFVTRELSARLGVMEFGVFVLLNAINSFIGYIDLGLGLAVTKFSAEYHAKQDFNSLQKLLGSSHIIFFITGFIGLVIFFILGKWFLPVFNIPAQSLNNIFIVFLLSGVVFFLNALNSVYSSVLAALQRFDLVTKIGMFSLIFVSLATIALLKAGFQLKAVMLVNVFSSLAQIIFSKYYYDRLLPEIKNKLEFSKEEIVKAYKFGFQTFVSSISDSCLVYLDRLFIPMFLGPSQLAYYSVPGNVALKISGVTNSLAGMLFPMTSALSGTGQTEKLKSVYIRSFRNLSIICASMSIAIAIFAEKILLFWLGPEYSQNGTVILRILSVTYYLIGLYVPLRSVLLGLGEIKILIRQSILMAAINFVLLILLIPKLGINGAAWAYLISVLPMVYSFYWVEKYIFKISGQASYYFRFYSKLILVGVLDALLIYFLLLPLASNVLILIVVGPFSVLLYMILFYVFGFVENEDEILFKNYLLQVKNKFIK